VDGFEDELDPERRSWPEFGVGLYAMVEAMAGSVLDKLALLYSLILGQIAGPGWQARIGTRVERRWFEDGMGVATASCF
jgi:hypothetical protein